MTTEEIIHLYIQEFEGSELRKSMLKGEEYYNNENDINNRKLYRYVEGQKVEDSDRPNNKLSHGFAKLLVDEKVNYLLGNSPKIAADDEKFQEELIKTLDYEFDDILHDIVVEASNKGIAWLQPYIDKEGELKFKKHDSEQIVPIWLDKAHTELQSLIRFYYVETYMGKEKEDIKKVEYWEPDGVTYYTYFNGSIVYDIEKEPNGEKVGHFLINNTYGNWGKVPFIAFKNNSREKNDLTYVKNLIDDYDKNTSDTSNTLDDIARFIYILKNYEGQDLAEFINDLKLYKAIKVDENGGVDKLSPDINIDAVEKHLNRLKKDIYIFGQGVDMDTDKFGNSPSGIALKFLYSSVDLKCDQLERKTKRAFKEIFCFIAEYLRLSSLGNFDYKVAKVTFNRNMIINKSEAITDVKNSYGIISNKTALEHHPYIDDVDEELLRIEEEKEEEENNLPNFQLENEGEVNEG